MKNIIVVLLVSLLMGFAGHQLYINANPQEDDKIQEDQKLIKIIEVQENDIEQWEMAVSDLKVSISEEFDRQTEGITTIDVLKDSLFSARYFANLTERTGSGLILSMNDNATGAEEAKRTKPETYNPADFILHDKNLLYVVNDLKRARPLGIAINNQRIVGDTNIRCVGTVILVNDRRLAPPYLIQVLGDKDKIIAEIQKSNELNFLVEMKYPITYQIQETLVLPAFTGSIDLEYAKLYLPPQEDLPEKAEEIIEAIRGSKPLTEEAQDEQ